MPRRRRAALRRLRRLFKPGPVGHTRKGVAYHIGNSIQGLRAMFRIGKRRADRDVIRTKDGVVVNTHWNRPLAHGFYDPARKWTRLQRVDQSTWPAVSRLRTRKGNYRIGTLDDDLAEMGRLGYRGAIIEPKSWVGLDNVGAWKQIKAMGVKHGVPLTGYALRGNGRCLQFMRAAGIPSKQLWR